MLTFVDRYYAPAYAKQKALPKNAKKGTVVLFTDGTRAVRTKDKQWKVTFTSYLGYLEEVYF